MSDFPHNSFDEMSQRMKKPITYSEARNDPDWKGPKGSVEENALKMERADLLSRGAKANRNPENDSPARVEKNKLNFQNLRERLTRIFGLAESNGSITQQDLDNELQQTEKRLQQLVQEREHAPVLSHIESAINKVNGTKQLNDELARQLITQFSKDKPKADYNYLYTKTWELMSARIEKIKDSVNGTLAYSIDEARNSDQMQDVIGRWILNNKISYDEVVEGIESKLRKIAKEKGLQLESYDFDLTGSVNKATKKLRELNVEITA